jgi:uncharacterized protein (DUF736 family)
LSNYETRPNTGSLFRNENKQTPNHPDYSGTCNIEGKEMFFDGWLKVSDAGKKWMSFSFKAKNKQPQQAPQQRPKDEAWQARQPAPKDDDSDIPF